MSDKKKLHARPQGEVDKRAITANISESFSETLRYLRMLEARASQEYDDNPPMNAEFMDGMKPSRRCQSPPKEIRK